VTLGEVVVGGNIADSPGRAGYLARLAARSAATRTVLCLGIDPDPRALPPGFSPDLAGVEAFATLLVEAASPVAAAVKPNLAFFEAFGSAGIAALERLRSRLPADVPVVMDAKRGDIGTTAARQAAALFDGLGADAITVSPYLGEEAIQPLLERVDRFAYVLCRTSNPGAAELQGLVVAADDAAGHPAEPLYARVARRATAWGPGGTVGLVVGATAPQELQEIRAIAPGLAFLVPGVGAQGGDEAAVLRDGRATGDPAGGRPGGGLLVNVSRGIAGAANREGGGRSGADVGEQLAAAARDWAARLPVLP
jgi:orotidine-5'-phosphate decarboxylase